MKNSINNNLNIYKKRSKRNLVFWFFWFVLFLSLIVACTFTQSPMNGVSTFSPSPSPSATASQLATSLPQSTTILLHQPRLVFPTPKIDPVTPIPLPISNLQIPDETRLLVLLGTDNPSPFISRTDAIMLVFYNPRLAKVSLVSLPPELFVYIPGYTMQRINIAFAVGEFSMLADTIEYNIGMRPDEYAVVHVDDFAWFVEELNGLDVDVFHDYYDYCGGIPAGNVHLRGGDVLCYVKFRDGWDIRDQAERQQQVVWRLFMRMISGGKLSDLENIYRTYKTVVQSNLNLSDLSINIPLAIRLGQVERFGFFQPTFDMFTTWDLPGDVKATVLLPRGDRLIQLIQEAIDFTTISVQNSDVILTLEYELTVSPTPTNTHTSSPTFTATITRTATITPVISPTRTVEGYPGPNATATTGGYPGPQPSTTTNPGYP